MNRTTGLLGLLAALILSCFAIGSASADDGEGAITLADAIGLVLQKSPELEAYSWDIRAAEARQMQAGLRPNPELSLDAEDVRLGRGPDTETKLISGGLSGSGASVQAERSTESGSRSGFSEAELTLSVSQLVELGGKRAKRIELAARERDVSAWDFEVARANVLKNTAQAFAALLAAQERVKLDAELAQLAEQVLSTVSARVEAGRVSPLEASKAQTALAAAQLKVNTSTGNLEAARSTLSALWGEARPGFERAEGRLEETRPLPELEQLLSAIAESPDLRRWVAELERREAVLAVEHSRAVPDVTASLGFRTLGTPQTSSRSAGFGSDGVSVSRESSDAERSQEHSLVLGLSVPLPLFNRNQGSILEAEHLASKAGAQRRATEVQTQAQLTKSYKYAATAYATIRSLKDNILPAATQTFESVNEAYRQGKFGYLDVLDAQRTLFEVRQEYLDALVSYHENVAEIERMSGQSLWKTDGAAPNTAEAK